MQGATWKQSEQVGELVKALCRARLGFGPVLKDQEAKVQGAKAQYAYRYADLASVIEATKVPLSEAELAVLQQTRFADDGRTILLTRLVHSSDQWFESEWEARPTQQTPQGEGSGLTYARRYQLLTVLGIATEDDDAQTSARYADRQLRDRGQQDQQSDRARRAVNEQNRPAPQRAEAPTNGNTHAPSPAPAGQPHDFGDYRDNAVAWWQNWYEGECRRHEVAPVAEHATVIRSPDQVRMAVIAAMLEEGVIQEDDILTEPQDGKPQARSKAKCVAAVAFHYQSNPTAVDKVVTAYLQDKAHQHLRALGFDPEREPAETSATTH